MKKLMMIAAAMTIAGGAFAQCADPETPASNCALVYKVKMSLKTTVAKSTKGFYDASNCEDVDGVCYRETGKVNLEGYAYACACSCVDFVQADLTVWDKKAKTYYIYDSPISWVVLNVIGKKSDKIEGSFLISDESAYLAGSGFGKLDKKSNIIKNISGNVAGWGEPPTCLDADCAESYAVAYGCDEDGWDASTELSTVYFGTFSYNYSATDSKKMAADGSYIYSKFPAWVL